MKRTRRVSLIALSCAMLSGLGSVRGKAPDTTPPGSPSQTQNAGATSSDEQAGAPYERWKSCARLAHPNGGDAAVDLQAKFERPQNIRQMLQNLQLAGEQDWLLQPNFYDAATLLKFFNGSGVAWKERKPDPLSKQVEVIAVDLHSDIFPQITISIEANCWIYNRPYPGGHVEKRVAVGGNMRIYGSPLPGMTLGVIRGVLGQETQNSIDTGTSYDGPDYKPIYKGRVVYENRAREQLEGAAMGTTFFFALGPPPPRKPGEPVSREILDDDVAKTIVMNATSHRILEN